eukprot:2769658-Pleurochrysis_carterae.AAC.1
MLSPRPGHALVTCKGTHAKGAQGAHGGTHAPNVCSESMHCGNHSVWGASLHLARALLYPGSFKTETPPVANLMSKVCFQQEAGRLQLYVVEELRCARQQQPA